MTSLLSAAALAISRSLLLSIVTQATIVLAVALVAVASARRARAAIRHAILVAAFAALAVLPFAAVLAPTTIPIAVRAVGPPEPPILDVAKITPPSVSTREATTHSQDTQRLYPSSTEWLWALWLTGAAISALPVAAALVEFRRLRQSGNPWPLAEQLAQSLSPEAGRTATRIVLHAAVAVPMTFGSVRPVIAFPIDAARWATAVIRNALVHEGEHVRRHDAVVQVVTRCVCALYWFHPAVWWAW